MAPPPDPSSARIPGPWAHRDVSANGIRLHVAELGDGPLVLLLHGFPEFWWSWRHQLVDLAEAGYRAVAVDLRGYGDSDKPPRGYDGFTLAGDVAGLVKALGEPRAHVVGHAWGGMLAWVVGALHPRLVRSVTAVSAPHPLALRRAVRRNTAGQARALGHLLRFQLPVLPERSLLAANGARVGELLRAWGGAGWTASPEFAEVVERNTAAVRIPGVAHSALEYHRWAVRSQVRSDGRRFVEAVSRKLEAPVLQVQGARDPVMLAQTALDSARWRGPDSVLRVLQDVGHFPHQEDRAEVSRVIAGFLAER
ncbi:alpha/beta hydrolase [Actinosynnema pretiosum subsp. pretiosum]|uniref:Alpha/beta hydrolase fold protein n=2 Tax=Actinosynnema TaxID=40566 RepID=C6WF96_ACTMD|nr:alpha/beta hydrolase [Actinosynnema mirum]ACU34228.1 alpha/beta hydrolase fold protein [Actinosynnema mirum DSM 43827]AXX27599.1 Epoxide hydrolase [Actinosynnema pretiosum subsp. pretiosum]QUF01692.1 alpha/beta hydrolase [Actinosynnema pretiosum subsp. pretiosum]